MFLKMECAKCQVSSTCPKRGSSPLMLPSSMEYCILIGGYGRDPVDPTILSEESKKASLRDGNALTLADVPELDESGYVVRNLTKVFSAPVRHAREKTLIPRHSDIHPTSHVHANKPR